MPSLSPTTRYNLHILRTSAASEISGALGDLGTLLPLMIALTIQGSIDLPATLVFSGVFNIATGAIFGIPLPVQPMKAIAAASITRHSSLAETTAAGGFVGLAVLFLSVTGLIRWLTHHIPVPVVKGIQLGAGLRLIISSGSSLILPLGWLSPLLDNRLWAVVVFLALLVVTPPRGEGNKTPPFGLLVFIVGVCFSVLGILVLEPPGGGGSDLRPSLPGWEVWRPGVYMPEFMSWESVGMAMGQLPLTTLNSIIAVSALAEDLFGGELQLPVSERREVPSPEAPSTTSLGISVAVMNISGCFFGCMPVCHGSGGLAAQHRFGARSGSSIILLGGFKIVLGLFLGKSLLGVLNSFPRSILGIMVAAAGLELARVGRSLNYGATDLYTWEDVGGVDEGGSHGDREQQNKQKRHRILTDAEREQRWTVMLMTTGGILAFKNDAVGFVAGLLCYGVYRLGEMETGSSGGEGGRITGTGRRRRYGVGVPGRKFLGRRRQRSRPGQVQARTEESPLLGSD